MPPADVVPLRASVVLIGDELLDGWVADRNAHWLAGRLSVLGIPLDRIVVVPDDMAAIDEALGAELARPRPRVVVTSGGIGSTPDDLTMRAVAAHLGEPLVENPQIAARIEQVLASAAGSGSPLDVEEAGAVRQMALAPAAGRVLAGSTGMVPGVVVDVDGGSDRDGGATVVILPGVPGQFREIVEAAVEPELLAGRGRPRRVVEWVHDHPESAFTATLVDLERRFPRLVVGSYPGERCVIRLKGDDGDVDAAVRVLDARADELECDPGAVARRDAWRARSRTDPSD